MVTVVFEVSTSNEEEAHKYVEEAMKAHYWDANKKAQYFGWNNLLNQEPMVVSVENIDE